MNCVEQGPEHIAFELESAHSFPLKLARVAIFQGNCERLVRIAPRLSHAATEIIQSARVDPGIKFFESAKPRGHQIGREKLRERRCDGDRPRLSACEIDVSIHCETNAWEQMSIFQS